MKVICINNKKAKNDLGEIFSAPQLTEGQVYTVTKEWGMGYWLLEVEPSPGFTGFTKTRFTPISEIDETEMIREYKKELV